MSKKASSTTRKKIVATRSSRDPGLPTNLTQSMDVTAAEAQIEKLKSIVMSKSTAPEPVKPVRAVKARKGKTEREVSTAETLPTSSKGSPKKKAAVKALSVVSTSHSSMGRTQSKWLSSLAR